MVMRLMLVGVVCLVGKKVPKDNKKRTTEKLRNQSLRGEGDAEIALAIHPSPNNRDDG